MKIILAVILTAALLFLFSREPEEVHFHAGFQVYKDNQLQDYSGLEYMHLEPCNKEGLEEEPTPEHEQEERAHLHDNIGDVVHVHRGNVIWRDLFKNINVEIDPDTKAYINGREISDFLNHPIKAYDSLIVLEGETELSNKLETAVTKEHIIDAESASENCGS